VNRRSFLRTAAAVAAAASPPVFAQVRRNADLAFVNARVVTMNRSRPAAEAVAVRAGRLLAVGSRPSIVAVCDRGTKMIDLDGKGLSPGLIDAHSHLVGFGHMELHFVILRPPTVHDFGSLCATLAEAAAAKPSGEWVVGRGFDEFDEGRFPLRQELDDATPHNPVLAIHWTGQYGLANTPALQKAGLLRADVKDPYGGKYLRDARTGLPDGRLLHYPAIYSVYQPTLAPSDELSAAQWGVQRFVEQGVTCVHDNFTTLQSSLRYIELERRGELPIRIRLYPYVANLEMCQKATATVRRYSSRLVRLQGAKLAVDGYPMMYRVPRDREQVNIPMHPRDQFEAIVATIHEAGLQVDVHAAGDLGVDWTLDAFSKAAGGDRAVRERRHRIEHFIFHKADSIARAGDMGIPVCTQPAWIPVRAAELAKVVGLDQVSRMIPLRSFRDAGVELSFGADVPASPTHLPLDSIRSAMTRQTAGGAKLDQAECVTFMEALEGHTIAAAYAAFDEKDMGSIEPGKYADLAVWSQPLDGVDESNISQPAVVATYVGGEPVWEAA